MRYVNLGLFSSSDLVFHKWFMSCEIWFSFWLLNDILKCSLVFRLWELKVPGRLFWRVEIFTALLSSNQPFRDTLNIH